ncbi:MAG: alternative ribosome rescue aminoacyl-tRNA hydrolase ArfB [Planctomycetota bacterium]
MAMIQITRTITINEDDIKVEFIRSSGPGGQNVNKVATAAQIRFDVKQSTALPEDVRKRLLRLAGKRITENGELVISARRFRTQDQNRCDAIERLTDLIRLAATPPKRRLKTKPTRASKSRRLDSKHRRGTIKGVRRHTPSHED